jgi:anion-transporting  ArsA/GET3 family ATPase
VTRALGGIGPGGAAPSARTAGPPRLAALVGGLQVVICCGSGGVGKTTVSAALAAAIAGTTDKRVLVLTIDPARRLATALGMSGLGADPVTVPAARLREAGLHLRGELVAAMLDQKSVWDRMVDRYAPNRQVARRILENRFYQGISDAFVGSHEYAAMEALYELHEQGEYDCLVVDTPPSRSALDFLEAPERIADFVGARLMSWLAHPSRLGFHAMNLAAAPLLHIADRLLGGEALGELGDFVGDLQTLYTGVQHRARAVNRLLRSSRVGFVVVTTLESAAFAEAEHFATKLDELGMPLRAVVVNRVLPSLLTDEAAMRAADLLADDHRGARALSHVLGVPVDAAAAASLGRAYRLLAELAQRDGRQLARIGRFGDVAAVQVPLITAPVTDLEGLVRVAAAL